VLTLSAAVSDNTAPLHHFLFFVDILIFVGNFYFSMEGVPGMDIQYNKIGCRTQIFRCGGISQQGFLILFARSPFFVNTRLIY
jgi:hypothetical protein